MDPLTILAIASLGVSAAGIGSNWFFGNKQQKLSEAEYYENLTSSYYSYMDQLNQMQGQMGQDQLAINQNRENIASSNYYLQGWADMYDSSMKQSVDEAFGQYQQMAGNLSAGRAMAGETGRRGGSASLIGMAGQRELGSAIDQYRYAVQNTALDMLADRQSAASGINTAYQAIGSYQDAMASLSESIGSMQNTTRELKTKLSSKGITV